MTTCRCGVGFYKPGKFNTTPDEIVLKRQIGSNYLWPNVRRVSQISVQEQFSKNNDHATIVLIWYEINC